MPRERKPKPKTKLQIRVEALFAQGTGTLRKLYPEIVIDETNTAWAYATGAWNNGKPHAAGLPSMTISLSEGVARTGVCSKLLSEVYISKDELERIQGKPNGLLFVHFGMDSALTFAQVPMGRSYRVTVYDKYAVPVEDLRFLTTFIDPTQK